MAALFTMSISFLVALQPASACYAPKFSWYDWTDGYQLVRDQRDVSLTAGQDIRNAFYAVDDGYRYFRIELYKNPSRGDGGYADLYGFYFNTGNGQDFTAFTTPLGFGVDSYVDTSVDPKLSGGLKFTPGGGTIVGGKEHAFSLRYDRNGKYIDWAIPLAQLSDGFSWHAASFSKDLDGKLTLLDRSGDAGIPIPGTAWLFGSGIAGLVAMRRRKRLA
jgi:hypothetical protein